MADVSVIIPCYNGERFIRHTIESVLRQTDPPRQTIVIDDGSTDRSAAIVEQLAASSGGAVELVRQANSGESRARNIGIDRATCAFVAFLDADDLWLPEKTAKQLQALENQPDAVAVHTRVFNFQDSLDDHGRAETEQTKDDPSVEDLISYHYISPSTLVVRKDAMTKNGLRFEEAVRHSEDMLFMADVRLAGPMRLVDETLVAKRTHAGQQTKNPWHTIYSLESRVAWCRKRANALGDELFNKLDRELGQKMIDTLEDRYWRRQVQGFADARRRTAGLFPDLVARNTLINRRIYPRWVYRLRDALRPSRR